MTAIIYQYRYPHYVDGKLTSMAWVDIDDNNKEYNTLFEIYFTKDKTEGSANNDRLAE